MPNLSHFKQEIRIVDKDPVRRSERQGSHRQMRVSGDIAIRALALGDSLKLPAPTFIVESERYAEFEASHWRDYDPVLCVPPCQAFYVKPVSPIRATAQTSGRQELVNLAGFYAFTIRHGYWLIAELIDVDGKIAATETVAHLGSDQVWIPSEREEGSYVPFSICDPAVFDDDELPRVDCQRIARNLISFLYFCTPPPFQWAKL